MTEEKKDQKDFSKYLDRITKMPEPSWLKNSLGLVYNRIGINGIIQIHNVSNGIVYLKLIKADGFIEYMPTSKSLSKEILDKNVSIESLGEYEIIELNSGYVCVSNVSSY